MVIAMAVVVVLASLVLVFAQEMRMEAQASANRAAALQANAVARGALAHVANQLGTSQDLKTLDSSMQTQGAYVGDGMFWIVRPSVTDERQYDYGVVDEASKLNINSASYDTLMKLPNMTSELAASIVDWRDADDTVTNGDGAENEYYLVLDDPYYCKNANFETLEELLLVKGATRELLYGVDANRNGVVDLNEATTPAASNSGGLTSINGNSRCGIMKYLTCYSQSANTDASGKARLNVNTADDNTLSRLLTKAGMTKAQADAALTKLRINKPLKSTFDFYFKMGLTLAQFKKIADSIATDPRKSIPGLINVNAAPKEVLNCLPGLESGDGDTLVSARNGADTTSTLWVLTALPQAKAVAICPYICAKSSIFSAEIVGVSGDGRAFKRVGCVFDASASAAAASSNSTGSTNGSSGSSSSSSSSTAGTAPKLLYYRDKTIFGWPLDPQILEQVRAGNLGNHLNAPGTTGASGTGAGATGK